MKSTNCKNDFLKSEKHQNTGQNGRIKTKLLEIELLWHLNCVLMLNWIGWNRTAYMSKNGFDIK